MKIFGREFGEVSGVRAEVQNLVKAQDIERRQFEIQVKSYSNWVTTLQNQLNGATGIGSVLQAVSLWIVRNVSEAELVMENLKGDSWVDGQLPAQISATFKNMHQTLPDKIAGVAIDLALNGNAVWVKLKNDSGKLVGFQYMPWSQVEPVQTDGINIQSYRIGLASYKTDSVIHFRTGVDPYAPYLRLSPWDSLQILNDADIKTTIYTKSLINSPAPGMIVTIEKQSINESTREALTATFNNFSSSSKAGQALVLNEEVKVHPVGFSPADLDISKLTDFIEERICALIGVHPSVVGLGAGANPTYSNFKEAQKIATVNYLVPVWKTIADSIYRQTPELFFELNQRLRFAYENIAALQSDLEIDAKRIVALYKAGIIDRAQAKAEMGYSISPEDEGAYASVPTLYNVDTNGN